MSKKLEKHYIQAIACAKELVARLESDYDYASKNNYEDCLYRNGDLLDYKSFVGMEVDGIYEQWDIISPIKDIG